MGEIVAAVGTCHTPYLFTRPPDENPEQLDQAAAAMRELGTVLDETKPDVILFLGSDHVETFSVDLRADVRDHRRQPGHREVRRPDVQPAGPSRDGRGSPQQAGRRAELRRGATRKTPSWATRLPCRSSIVIGKRDIPIIPFFTNVYVPPLPTPQRCAALGKAHRRDHQRPEGARRDHRQRRHVAFPGHTKYLHPGVRFRPLAGVAVRGGQHRRAART